MKLRPIMELNLRHSYYEEGCGDDIEIDPAPDTIKLLNKHRCILKAIPGGVCIISSVTEDDSPLIPFAQGDTFAFRLRLKNPEFSLFTDLTAITGSTSPHFINTNSNAENPVILELISRPPLSTESFTIAQPAPEEYFILSGNPSRNVESADFHITGANESIGFVGYDAISKQLTVDSSAALTDDQFEITYPVEPPQQKDVLANVEIHYDNWSSNTAEGPQQFHLLFTAKSARWKYYVIVDKSDAKIRIVDNGQPALKFSHRNRTNLNRYPDETDDIARDLAEQYPRKRRFRFVSDESVPSQKKARKTLQLLWDGSQIAGALPNPSVWNYDTVVVEDNGIVQKKDSLYQVVKYFNHKSK